MFATSILQVGEPKNRSKSTLKITYFKTFARGSKGFNILFTTKTPDINIVKNDPDDDKFIECAVALRADVIVTGDKEVLGIKKYIGIKILTPKEFLEQF